MSDRWARFDTESNAMDSLEKTAQFLRTVKDNPEDWKWVIVSSFSSLYGFAIQVAKGSDDRSVIQVTKKGHERLITFGDALKKCKQSLGARAALETSKDEDDSINKIQNEFRNKFEHFNPGSWSIEISGFPSHIFNIVNVIERLALDINFYSHLSISQKDNLKYVIAECKFITSQLGKMYA
ncbi:hypothetical protein GCM10009111_23550 [Colwellia asteriadis]|uniref:Uncharacterized protein n=1 Tax=Colwellia asteriadis TaxID=517723 RepID=A0ABP3WJS1_9GAMM